MQVRSLSSLLVSDRREVQAYAKLCIIQEYPVSPKVYKGNKSAREKANSYICKDGSVPKCI